MIHDTILDKCFRSFQEKTFINILFDLESKTNRLSNRLCKIMSGKELPTQIQIGESVRERLKGRIHLN